MQENEEISSKMGEIVLSYSWTEISADAMVTGMPT